MATNASQRDYTHVLAAIAAAAAGVLAAPVATAADLSGERTYMPEFCTNRDVNCVVPDGPPRGGAPAPLIGTKPTDNTGKPNPAAAAGTGGVLTVPAVPTASGQVPSLPGQVPSLPAQVPSTTSSGGAPDIAPNPSTARTLGRSSGGASGTTGGSAGTGAGGSAAGGGTGGTAAGGGSGGASRR